MWRRTTTTSHGNRKVQIELANFLKTITLGHFPAKCHGCCAFRWNFWVGVVVFGAVVKNKEIFVQGGIVLHNVHLYSSFLIKLHLCPLLLLIYFAFSPSLSGIDAMRNWCEKLCIFHGLGDNIGWESDEKKYPYFGENMGTNFPGSLNSMDFAAFSNAIENWWGNLSISPVMKYITGRESGWRNFIYSFSIYSKLAIKLHFCYLEMRIASHEE